MNLRWFPWLMLAAFIFIVAGWAWPAHGQTNLSEWFESLHRDVDNMSCCGHGDAYKVFILQEADPSRPDEDTGTAEIIDGSAKDIETDHGPIHRNALPNGTRFMFHYNNKAEKGGNPTAFAWAFLSVYSQDGGPSSEIHNVYCVVPLPPGV